MPCAEKTFSPDAKSSQDTTRGSWRALCVRSISSADLQAQGRDCKKKKWFGFQSMLRGLQALWWKPTKLSHWHFLGMFCCSALLLYPPDLSESYCSCLHCLLWHNLTACKGPTKISVLLSAQITAALPLDTAPELLYSHSLQTLPLGTAVLK